MHHTNSIEVGFRQGFWAEAHSYLRRTELPRSEKRLRADRPLKPAEKWNTAIYRPTCSRQKPALCSSAPVLHQSPAPPPSITSLMITSAWVERNSLAFD